MKKWVKFDKSKGVLVDTLDQNRAKRLAIAFEKICSEHQSDKFVQEVFSLYSEIVTSAKDLNITQPLSTTPSVRHIEDVRGIPVAVRKARANLDHAILGMDRIREIVGFDEFYSNESLYLKELEGQWYIWEEFEN